MDPKSWKLNPKQAFKCQNESFEIKLQNTKKQKLIFALKPKPNLTKIFEISLELFKYVHLIFHVIKIEIKNKKWGNEEKDEKVCYS